MKLKILQLSKENKIPSFKMNRNGEWIDFGVKNLYPQDLLDIYHEKSNKHKAIVNRKVDMIGGNGIEENPSLKSFIDNIFAEDSLTDIVKMISYDYEIFNGFALLLRYNKEATKIVAIDHLPFEKCRLSADEEFVYVSKDWSAHRKNENKPIQYKRFDGKDLGEERSQILYYVEKVPGIDYYTLPSYTSTLNWIELDYEIGNFHLNSVKNGFMPSFLINFATGIPSEEEMEETYKEFKKNFQGSDNAGKFILTYSEGKEQAPELTAIQLNDSDERFLMLQKQIQEEIFVGHGVINPNLMGIRVPGELGGKNDILESLAIFQSVYIDGRQNTIERQFQRILTFNGIDAEFKLNKYEIDFGEIIDDEEIIEEKEIIDHE